MSLSLRFGFVCPVGCRECCHFSHLSLKVGRSYPLAEILEAVNLTPILAEVMFNRAGPEMYCVSATCRHYEESSGLCRTYSEAPWACKIYPLIITARDCHFAVAVETGCAPGEVFYERYRRGVAAEQRHVQQLVAELKAGRLPSDAFVSAGSTKSRTLVKGTLAPG